MAARKPRRVRRTRHNSRAKSGRKRGRASRKRPASLEVQVAEAAKNAETAEAFRGKIAELKAQGESDRIDFKLQLADVRNVKAARALLGNHGNLELCQCMRSLNARVFSLRTCQRTRSLNARSFEKQAYAAHGDLLRKERRSGKTFPALWRQNRYKKVIASNGADLDWVHQLASLLSYLIMGCFLSQGGSAPFCN